MQVSVITITYNSAATVEDTIHSVSAQDWPDKEYIIVDGASVDGTLPLINKYQGSIQKIISEKDKGIYDAMNKGIKMANGDIIALLNSDDVYTGPEVLSEVVQKFKETGADAVYGDLAYKDRDLQKILRYWKAGEYKDGMFLKGWMPAHPAFFVRKEVYEKFGLFNTALKTSADYEIMLRFIHKEKIKVAYLPKTLVYMRVGGQSNISIKNRLKANLEDRLAWKLNGLKPGAFTLFLKPLSKIRQYKFF
jgi:glycosyltransferase involved in cell wall biosynthesis